MRPSIYNLFFLFIFHLCISAQVTNTAVICDPQLGSNSGEENFISIIEDINLRTDIDLVVIIGNLTYSGSFDELLILETILNKLTIPFRIVSGPNDVMLNETRGEEILQIWPEGQNTVHSTSSDKYFLQAIPLRNSNSGHIPIETLNKLSKEKPINQNVFLFTYNSFKDYIDNWFKLSNLSVTYKIFSFSFLSETKKNVKNISNCFTFTSLSESNEWSYNIIRESDDAISIYKVSAKQMQPELIKSLTINEFAATEYVDSVQTIPFYPGIRIDDFEEKMFTTYTPILSDDNRIFLSIKSGTIFCYNESGEKLWMYATNGQVFNSILKDRDLIIAIIQEGDIHTINANNGDLFQAISTGEITSSDINLIDIEYNDLQTKGIIFGTASGYIYCYELYSLEMIWENKISEFNITSKPLISNDKIIFQDAGENYYCVNPNNGVLIWKWNADVRSKDRLFRSDFICNNNSVYITDSDRNIHSVDILLGTTNWSKKISTSGNIYFSEARSSIFAHSFQNRILEIDKSKGKVLSEIKLAEEFKNIFPSSWLESESGLLIGFDNGVIAMIDKKLNFHKVIFSGNSPVISIVEIGEKRFVTNNLDCKITKFTLP